MKLRKLGGRYQPIIERPEDIFSIINVDFQHWSANCAPIMGLACDPKFLHFLDVDHNGKVLPKEVISSLRWLKKSLNTTEGIWSAHDFLPLSNFCLDHPLGRDLKESAAHVLHNLHVEDDILKLEHVRARAEILQAGAMNGDGVIPASAIENLVYKTMVEDLIAITGGVQDVNGELGLNAEQIETFCEKAQQWLLWKEKEPSVDMDNPENALAVIEQIQPIFDRFFTACMVPKSSPEDVTLLSVTNEEGILSKDAWIHPMYRDLWNEFVQNISFTQISWRQWEYIWSQAQHYKEWTLTKPVGHFERISRERLTALLEADEVHAFLLKRIREDQASSHQISKLVDLEKTLLLQQNIRSFLSSYVNFSHFYNPKKQSLPESGNVLMDGRIFRLSVWVENREEHKKRAQDSGFFLLYIKVFAPEKPFEIATAVTGKRRGDLHIGKKGIFISSKDQQWPAEVMDILNNPINIREAFWAPFSSVRGFVQKRFETLSSKHQQELESTIEKNVVPKAENSKVAMLNGGVTVAALSSSLAYLLKTLSSIQLSQIITLMLAPMLVVAIFSSVIAWWKLQNRDLGPILEASGWGINHPLYAPSWATQIFTEGAVVAKKNRRRKADLLIDYQKSVDPYGRSRSWLLMIIFIVLMLMFLYGFDDLVMLFEWSDWNPQNQFEK